VVDYENATEILPDLCTTVSGNATVNLALSCTKKFKGN